MVTKAKGARRSSPSKEAGNHPNRKILDQTKFKGIDPTYVKAVESIYNLSTRQ